MFIDPMRDGAALRQRPCWFYMHTLLDLHGPPDGGRARAAGDRNPSAQTHFPDDIQRNAVARCAG